MANKLVEVIDWNVRYNGKTYGKGDLFQVNESHLTKSLLEFVKDLGFVAADQTDDLAESQSDEWKELEAMSAKELREYAAINNIELGKITAKEAMLRKIKKHKE